MTREQLAGMIDHTVLKPLTTLQEVDRVVDEAIAHSFASVCITPPFVAHVAGRLRSTPVKVCTVVGFPNGTNKATLKAIEATSTIKDGADEIDVVAFLPHLVRLDFTGARDELIEVVRAARATRPSVVIKVIIESAALLAAVGERGEQTIELACRAVRESGCDYIKTSTGFHPAGGATVEAVTLMHHYAGGLGVKASGGIRDYPTACRMIEAGATRLGLSSSVEIVEAFGAVPSKGISVEAVNPTRTRADDQY